jgi:hypothetical protein
MLLLLLLLLLLLWCAILKTPPKRLKFCVILHAELAHHAYRHAGS